MPEEPRPRTVRVLTAAVSPNRSRTLDEVAKAAGEELRAAGFEIVRHVGVKGEPQFLQALVSNVSTDNEADAILAVGGTGFGPHDTTTEALDAIFERRIEGFAEAYRRLLRGDVGVHALLSRATAGVFNQCLVFALSGRIAEVRLATQMLIAPVLRDAVEIATARGRSRVGA